jgi:hypothetical protein
MMVGMGRGKAMTPIEARLKRLQDDIVFIRILIQATRGKARKEHIQNLRIWEGEEKRYQEMIERAKT